MTRAQSLIYLLLWLVMSPVRVLTARFRSTPTTAPVRRICGLSAPADALSIATLKKLGVTRTRMTLVWNNYLDPRQFLADRSTVDPSGHTIAEWFAIDLAAFLAAAIDPLIVVHTPPNGMTLAQGIVAMPTFMAGVATQFRGRSWQIMNEMDDNPPANGDQNWFNARDGVSTQNQRGDLYGQVLGPVYDAMKAADPTATVMAGGIALEPTAFFAGLVGRAPGKYDAIAVHCYGPPMSGVFVAKSTAMRAVLGAVPLWCTEFGNNVTDDDDQAQDIGAALDENDRNARYDRIYLYTLMPGDDYNVVRADGSWRHAALLLPDRVAP
jgi:hypothetical protein